jgi:peptidoglycan/LPS O-acetylase OafA/YrhL
MGSFLKIDIKHDRLYGLDILRFLAILFVMIEHGNNLLPQKYFSTLNLFVFDGVSLFFVLSGFLIGEILIKEFENNNISFKVIIKFWKRRWFRTLPNYFSVLIILILLQFLFANNFPVRSISKYFIFSQNLYYPQSSFFPESWCLSVEEWFYLLTTVIILFAVYIFNLQKKIYNLHFIKCNNFYKFF